MPRRQPEVILGGSITTGLDGYRLLPQYTPMYPTPMSVQQIYSTAITRRYPPKWDGKEPEAKQVIRLTDPFPITTECCYRSLGEFVAYQADEEFGVIRHDPKQRHLIGNFPPDHFANQPNDAFAPKNPTFRLDGEVGGEAAKAYAVFWCPKCRKPFNPRNLAKLGKHLFEAQPTKYSLARP